MPAPTPGTQGGVALGPSLLSDVGKPSPPPLGPCSQPPFLDIKAFLSPGEDVKMQKPRPSGESLVSVAWGGAQAGICILISKEWAHIVHTGPPTALSQGPWAL